MGENKVKSSINNQNIGQYMESKGWRFGKPELEPEQSVSLIQAKKLLGNCSDGEIALFIRNHGLKTYESKNTNLEEMGLLRPIRSIGFELENDYGNAAWLMKNKNYLYDILSRYRFSKEQVKNFLPSYKYISFNNALKEIEKEISDCKDYDVEYSINQLYRLVESGKLNALLPLSNTLILPFDNSQLMPFCYFESWQFKNVLYTEYFENTKAQTSTSDNSAQDQQAEALADDSANSQTVDNNDIEESVYTKRKASLDAWLAKSGFNIHAPTIKKETILEQIKIGCKPEDSYLWKYKFSSFTRDFWPIYSKENGINKQRGRRPSKK